MKLRFSLVSSFLGVASLVALVGLFNIYYTNNLTRTVKNLSRNTEANIIALQNLKSASLELVYEVTDLALLKSDLTQTANNLNNNLTKEEARIKNSELEIKRTKTSLEILLKKLKKLYQIDKGLEVEPKILKRIEERQLEIYQIGLEIIELEEIPGNRQFLLENIRNLEKSKTDLFVLINQAIAEAEKSLYAKNQLLNQSAYTVFWFNITLVPVIAFLASAFGIILGENIAKPIVKIKDAAIKVGQGKLDIKVDIKSKNEIGTLANAFNKMVEDINRKTVSKRYLDNIIKSMIDALIVVNPEGVIKDFNFATLMLLGYEEDSELMGYSIAKIFADRTLYEELANEAEVKNSLIGRKETMLLGKNDREIPVYFSASVMRDETGKIEAIVCLAHDISQQKQAQEEKMRLIASIEQSEHRYHTLAAVSPVGIFHSNTEGISLYVNERFCQITGLTETEALARNWAQRIHAEDRDRVLTQWRRSAQKKLPFQSEFRFLHRSGKVTWVLGQAAIETDPKGEVRGYVGAIADITELKLAEAALRESEEKWRSIAQNAPDIIVMSDAQGKIQFINRPIPDWSPQQVMESSVYDLVPPKNRKQLQTYIQKIFETGEAQSFEMAGVGPHGSLAWYSIRVGPIRSNGQAIAAVLIGTDITERKWMEEALRESEERLEGILNSLEDVVWSVAADSFEVLYLNPATEKVYGRSVSAFLDNSNLRIEVVHPEDRQRVVRFWQALKKTGSKELKYRIVRPDGEVRWLQDRARVSRDAKGKPIRIDGIATDITVRKRAEEALKKANEQLEIRVQKRTAELRRTNEQLQRESLERQLVVEALHESQQRLNGILHSIDDVVWSTSATTFEVLYLSPAVETVYGRRASDFFENPNLWREVVYPKDAKLIDRTLQNCFERGSSDVEYRIVRPCGEVRWLRQRTRLVYDVQGNPLRIDGIATDVTQRKQAEEEKTRLIASVQKSEERYRAIVEDQTELICRFLPDQTLTFVNDAYCRYFRKSREELIGTSFMAIVPPEDRVRVQKHLHSICKPHPVVSYEHRVILFDREIRIQQWTNRAIFDPSGAIEEFQAVGRDITQRKRAEAALRKSEAGYRKLAQQEALINQLTEQIRKSLNIDTILETAVVEIRNLLQIDRCLFIWYRPNGIKPHTVEFGSESVTANSHHNTQHLTVNAITFPCWEVVKEARNPHVPSLLGHYQIGPESRAIAKLLKGEIIRVDDLSRSLDRDRQQLYSWGYTSMVLLPIHTFTGDMGVVSCGHCSGSRPWSDREVGLLQAISNQLAIAISQAELYERATDSAQQAREQAQQLEQALHKLQQTQAQLIQTEKMSSLGQMVAGVAHEINNPVSFIYGNVEPANEYIENLLDLLDLYQKHYPEPMPEIQEEIDAIELDFVIEDLPKLMSSMKVGANRIRDIVLSLRNFSRLDEAEMKAVDLHQGIDSTLLILQNRLKANSERPEIQVIKDYANLPQVECYSGEVNQVFMNLLANAIDALEASVLSCPLPVSNNHKPCTEYSDRNLNPIISIRTARKSENQIEIRIADNGTGMTDDVRQRIFDPFFTTKPVGSGTGLGLSISYQIVVEKHQGTLECFSNLGEGTEFVISLPIHQKYSEPAIFR